MSETTTINGLLCLDEAGRYELIGVHDWSDEQLVAFMRDGLDGWRDDRQWGLITQCYRVQLQVPRPLLSQLQIKIEEMSASQYTTADCKRIPADDAFDPRNDSETCPVDPEGVPDDSPTGESDSPDADAGDTILERIEQKLRAAGGALAWTQIEYLRPVAITHQVFLATVSKRFTVEKRGRGLRVKLKEDQR